MLTALSLHPSVHPSAIWVPRFGHISSRRQENRLCCQGTGGRGSGKRAGSLAGPGLSPSPLAAPLRTCTPLPSKGENRTYLPACCEDWRVRQRAGASTHSRGCPSRWNINLKSQDFKNDRMMTQVSSVGKDACNCTLSALFCVQSLCKQLKHQLCSQASKILPIKKLRC